MDEQRNNNGQFRMRMDEAVDDNVIPSQVDELRLEKLSTKVTIISIIIPVLIVVVLAIAYLDMKKRVTFTQDTGTSGVENLSRDMESRFSSLSMRQANLDELIRKMGADNNKAIARIEVKLKKIEDGLKSQKKSMVSKSTLDTRADRLKEEIGTVAQAVQTGNIEITQMGQQLKDAMENISTSALENQSQMAQINEKLTGLDQEKIDKASLDLALKLELLKLKKSQKAQLDDIQARLRRLEQRPTSKPAQMVPPSKATPEVPAATQPPKSEPESGILEQKIGK